MRWRRTMIEALAVKHPGLDRDVCNWLKGYFTGDEIAARLLEKYNVTVSAKNINSYRRRRVNRVQKRVEEQKISYEAFMQFVGEKGLDAGAAAHLWEALQCMTPTELIELRRLQVERKRVEVLDKRVNVDAQRAENTKQRLNGVLEQLKAMGKQAKGVAGRGAEGKPTTARELRRQIREMYGLPDDSAEIEDHPVTADKAVLELADATYGIGKYGSGRDGSEADRAKCEAGSPEPASAGRSDDQNSPGPGTSDNGLSSPSAAATPAPGDGRL